MEMLRSTRFARNCDAGPAPAVASSGAVWLLAPGRATEPAALPFPPKILRSGLAGKKAGVFATTSPLPPPSALAVSGAPDRAGKASAPQSQFRTLNRSTNIAPHIENPA